MFHHLKKVNLGKTDQKINIIKMKILLHQLNNRNLNLKLIKILITINQKITKMINDK